MKFDKNKKYQLRNGYEYKFYSDKNGGKYSIHGAYCSSSERCWQLCSHTEEGTSYPYNSSFDLIEIKEKKTVKFRLNIFKNGYLNAYICSENECDILYNSNLAAIKEIEIEYYEGEGLENARRTGAFL